MSVIMSLVTGALFEQREPTIALNVEGLAETLEFAGPTVWLRRIVAEGPWQLQVRMPDDEWKHVVTVHSSGTVGWRGGLPLGLEERIVRWYFDQVAGREDVWLYSDNGDLCLRLSPDTYRNDLARVQEGWREQRDLPPGFDLG